MTDQIDVTKIPGYRPEWSYHKKEIPQRTIVPRRHICGEIIQADITGESVLFYSRFNLAGEGAPITFCPLCGFALDMTWMRKLYLVDPMPYDMAVNTRSRKVCSNCWGWNFTEYEVPVYDEDGFQILEDHRLLLCSSCMEETRGYVTQRYVGYAREQDALDYGRALNGLIEALELEQEGIPVNVEKVKKPVNELMNELGF